MSFQHATQWPLGGSGSTLLHHNNITNRYIYITGWIFPLVASVESKQIFLLPTLPEMTCQALTKMPTSDYRDRFVEELRIQKSRDWPPYQEVTWRENLYSIFISWVSWGMIWFELRRLWILQMTTLQEIHYLWSGSWHFSPPTPKVHWNEAISQECVSKLCYDHCGIRTQLPG